MSLRWRAFLLSNCIFCLPLAGVAKDLERKREEAFSFEATYTADNVYNFSGGIESGYAYLGMGVPLDVEEPADGAVGVDHTEKDLDR